MPRSTWLNILIILLVIIAAAYLAQLVWGFFSGFSDIILIVVLSWLVAYALGPIVDAMSGRSPFTRLVKIAKLDPDTGMATTRRLHRDTPSRCSAGLSGFGNTGPDCRCVLDSYHCFASGCYCAAVACGCARAGIDGLVSGYSLSLEYCL